MKYTILAQGFVSRREPGTPTSTAGGPRCVVTRSGSLLCSFMVQSALGINDFKPMLARSADGGITWSEASPVWPKEIHERHAICLNLSSSPEGELLFYGFRSPIESPGETYWSEAASGLKQNELVWTRSRDEGFTWEPLRVISMPIPGSAEVSGPMCATRKGDLVCCYAPYNTFDPGLMVEKNLAVSLASRDGGRSWKHAAMLRFPHPDSQSAETWVVELSDGRLLGAGWHIRKGSDPPNPYAISEDAGGTWGPTLSTGILGQTTALAPLPDGRVLLAYNQRKCGDVGVWLAVARPTGVDFGIIHNQRIWAAEIASERPDKAGSDDLEGWTSFAFGQPCPTVLPDGSVFVALWVLQPSGRGIRYVKLRID